MEKSTLEMERIIGRYGGSEKGPLLVILGAVHGNEPAGVKATEVIFKLLDIEPYVNAHFNYKGNVLGILGNKKAYEKKQRFIERDLNRCWTMENITLCQNGVSDIPEKYEMLEIYELIKKEVIDTQTSHLIVLDMHTTSSDGGIFTIPSDEALSLKIAKELHAPVITGMIGGLGGTSLHFFNEENIGVKTTAVVFESGQHDDPLSVNRAIAAIINCMRTIGSIESNDVHNKHDELLIAFSKNLPKVNNLIYSHAIEESDQFVMKKGYSNFQKIKKGDYLADDKNGKLKAPYSGRILMPLYQKKGEDGYFIIQDGQKI